MSETYLTITPFGIVDAVFGEDAGVQLQGSADAVAYVREVAEQCTGRRGMAITLDSVDPRDYVHFCQPEGRGITIVPPASAMLDEVDEPDEASEWGAILDGVEELPGLRQQLAGASGALAKLALAKAIRAARVEPAEDWTPFVHGGLKVFPVNMRSGDGTVARRWQVQTPENAEREARGERQIGGDALASTRAGAIERADEMLREVERRKAWEAEEASQAEADRIAEAKLRERRTEARLLEFVKGMTPANAARALKTLEKEISVRGKFKPTYEHMRDLVREGFRINQDGTRLATPDGSFFTSADFPVTAFNYAAFLAASASEPAKPANPAGLTDEQMVVLLATKGHKPAFRFQNAERTTGITMEAYNAARADLETKGFKVNGRMALLMKRGAITSEGEQVVAEFRPDLPFTDGKLRQFSGRWPGYALPPVEPEKKEPEPVELPANVAAAIDRMLAPVKQLAESLDIARGTDVQFKGGGRYAAELWQRLNGDQRLKDEAEKLAKAMAGIPSEANRAAAQAYIEASRARPALTEAEAGYFGVSVEPTKPTGPTFRYGLMNRPADLGTVPRGLAYTVEPRPAAGQPHHDMARHGILVAERELTAEEVKAFELAVLVDGPEAIGALAEQVARAMGEYAAAYVEEARDDRQSFAAQVMQTVRASASGIAYSVADPELLVQSVVDKLAAMVAAEPAPPPTPEPGPGPGPAPGRDADLATLLSIAGAQHPDMLEPELGDLIEGILTRYPDDADIQAAGERAVIAYSNGLMAATGS